MSKRTNQAPKVNTGVAINPLYINIAFTVAIALSILYLMGYEWANYLRKIELLSLFLPTADFYSECMLQPGGWLRWMSAALTQTFYYPWLGASIYTILLVGTSWLAVKAFRMPKWAYPALLILCAGAVLALLNLGYVIFSLKTPSVGFLLPLGMLVAILAFWAYRSLPLWIRAILMIVIVCGGYITFGAYALICAAMCITYEAVQLIRSHGKEYMRIIPVLLGGLGIWLFPQLWVQYVHSDVPISSFYRAQLPSLYDDEAHLWLPYMVVTIALMALSACAALAFTSKSRRYPIIAVVIGICALSWLWIGRENDGNLRLTLDLDHYLWEQQWDKAIDRMAAFDEEPTRVNVILSSIAMIRSGRAADELFSLPNGSADYATSRSLRAAHDIASRMLAYHTGLNNYAYRWAMEYKVEHGTSVEHLKFLAKTALLNGEYPLARKYLEILMLTPNHRKWAEKYMAYADDPTLIASDSEMSEIQKVLTEVDTFIDDQGHLEGYVWFALARVPTGTDEMLRLSLISGLICRDLDAFMERLPFYAGLHPEPLPRHFQEGLLLWSRAKDSMAFRNFNVDPQTLERYRLFLHMQQQFQGLSPEQQREMMRPSFGDTYWFYAIYMTNQKVI